MSLKYILPASVRRYFPPEEDALYKDNFAIENGELYKIIADVKTAAQDCCSLTKAWSSMPLTPKAVTRL